MALTFDESVYASQVGKHAVATMFTAPRARGMPWLLAPVAGITTSIFALRVYLTLLASVLLYVAFQPWIATTSRDRRIYSYVPAVAAACFASLWITILYGPMAYPNLWLTFALVGGLGYFCQAVTVRSGAIWRPLTWVVVAFAAAATIRPTDALAAAVPLLLFPVVIRGSNRLAPAMAVLGGLALGWSSWIVEAYVRFGGPLQRLKDGAEINSGGLAFTIGKNLDALDGPRLLCLQPSWCAGVDVTTALWWFALPVLVAIGLYAARRTGWLPYASLAVASALFASVQYLFLINYAAPRFLLPAYGLLAIPAAAGLIWLVARPQQWARILAGSLALLVFIAHLRVQGQVLASAEDRLQETARQVAAQARFLREEGIERPCLVWGQGAIQLSYLLKCRSQLGIGAARGSAEQAILAARERGDHVVVELGAYARVPEFLSSWRRVGLPGTKDYVVYIPRGQ